MLFRFERRIPAWKRAAVFAAIGVAVAISTQRLIEGELGGPSAAQASAPPAPAALALPDGPAALGPAAEGLLALALAASTVDEARAAAAHPGPRTPEALALPRRLQLATREAGALSVPEPGTAPLLGAGLIGLVLLSRRLAS